MMKKLFGFGLVILAVVIQGFTSFTKPPLYPLKARWMNYHQLDDKKFTRSSHLTEVKRISNPITAQLLDSEFAELFYYSPDSSYCIDLFSYSLMLDRDSTGELYSSGWDVHSKIDLIKFDQKKVYELMLCGSSCVFEEIQWLNDSTVQAYGFENLGDRDFRPFIYEFDILNSTQQVMRYDTILPTWKAKYIENVSLKGKVRFEY